MIDGPTNESAPVFLEARRVAKAFPGVQALDGVGLKLRAGRLNALMGENGAGKSTLMKILAGVHQPDAGALLLDGRPVRFRSPRDAQDAGIAIIHQELNLVEHLSVAENVFLGREPVNRLSLIDRARMLRDSHELLNRMGVSIDPATPVATLPVAEQQVVEIAKALSQDARVLILDEPTSALSASETAALFERINQLKRDGVALAYITHRFDELDAIADEVTVFRDGRLVDEIPFTGLSRDQLVRMMIGRELQMAPTSRVPGASQPLISVRDLTLAGRRRGARAVVDGVSLEVRAGEVVGLFGLMGAGRTELLESLFGLHPRRTTGQVEVSGCPVRVGSTSEALAAGLALAPEDRKATGLVLGMSVGANITLASLDEHTRAGLIDPTHEREAAQRFIDRLRIKTPSSAATVRNLSGGNQQKVVLAKMLATDPSVLLLDEPTRGIDVGAKQEVYGMIHNLASEGRAVLVASSEASEVITIADRILVMCDGRIAGEFDRNDADEHRLIEAALPKDHAKGAA